MLVKSAGLKDWARKNRWPLIVGSSIATMSGTAGYIRKKRERERSRALISELIRREQGLQKNAFFSSMAKRILTKSPKLKGLASRAVSSAGRGVQGFGTLAAKGLGAAGSKLRSLGNTALNGLNSGAMMLQRAGTRISNM